MGHKGISATIRVVAHLGAALAVASVFTIQAPPAMAQTVTPSQWMVSHKSYPAPPIPYVTVVQGEELLCDHVGGTSLATLENTTVQLLNNGKAAVSEITIYGPCGWPDSTWENDIKALASYVESHTSDAAKKWLGVMLDEESAWGTVGGFYNIDNVVATIMGGTPGVSWWFNEEFSGCGDWTQAQYNQVLGSGYDASQIPNSCAANYANHDGSASTLVTWSVSYPPPYNSQAASVNAIHDSPFYACPYYSGTTCAYMSNEFVAGS